MPFRRKSSPFGTYPYRDAAKTAAGMGVRIAGLNVHPLLSHIGTFFGYINAVRENI